MIESRHHVVEATLKGVAYEAVLRRLAVALEAAGVGALVNIDPPKLAPSTLQARVHRFLVVGAFETSSCDFIVHDEGRTRVLVRFEGPARAARVVGEVLESLGQRQAREVERPALRV